jgi:imidazole glycerol-phosphate synthase subunit HisF
MSGLRVRIIPTLLLHRESLVKTVRFGKFTYVGDPCNTVRIFNEFEVDELLFLDIAATRERHGPNLKVLSDIASECFMPLGYGGGIRSLDHAKSVFDIGFEKVAINTCAVEHPSLITDIAGQFGSQAVMVAIDVKTDFWNTATVRTEAGRHKTGYDPVEWAKEVEGRGAGEIMLTSIDREGTWEGFDLSLVKRITEAVSIPVIAHGGGGSVEDIGKVVKYSKASAVALGSLLVFQKRGMGVLVHYLDRESLEAELS